MQVIHSTCAGIDVHKRDVKVCLVRRDAAGQRTEEIRTYRTMTKDLLAMKEWLLSHGCRVVAMESTGVYWKPLFNLVEGELEVMLVNPSHIKQVPERKTDVRDCQWIAQLLEHGLLKGSFIPPVAIRDLRDLTRYRRKLVEARAAEVNRVHKLLKSANIKLASVASDIMGASGRAMLNALVAGERDGVQLSELSRGRLRRKRKELAAAMEGRFAPHHARMLRRMMTHIEFLDESIAECEAEIEEMCRPFAQAVAGLDTITGIDKRAAQDLIAEIGVDMSPFASHKHLCSWAKMCPGNNESGGKRKSGRTGKGNKWVRSILVECAHAAGRSQGTYLSAQYSRFARRKGRKHAAVVVGHSMLEAAYFILRDNVPYHELGAHHFDTTSKAHAIRYHIRRLENLGLQLDIQELPLAG